MKGAALALAGALLLAMTAQARPRGRADVSSPSGDACSRSVARSERTDEASVLHTSSPDPRQDGQALTRARYLMGTFCEVTAGREAEIANAFAECARIEALLSTWRDDSQLAQLDRTGSTTSPELIALLKTALAWRDQTGGAFDPLVAPLLRAWNVRGEGAVPVDATIAAARATMKRSNVTISDSRLTLANGAEFEEGAFGKGYALDRMLQKIESHEALLNFGGQLLVRGSAGVTIADPEHRDRPVVSLTISNASLATSSGSEKTFKKSGVRFSHIVDPHTGRALPPRGSATALAADALTADILSTALYVMGPDAGLQWADAHGVAALFITPDHTIRPSRLFRMRTRDLVVVDPHHRIED